jgi:hypothetical protein
MNCEDVPMSEWDKLTGAAEEALEVAFVVGSVRNRPSILQLIKPLIDGEGRPLA